ncbi:DUF4839 domain-containing protein [Arthrobacter sp. zg-Y916]|uniref:DUF4839 domain-containing protein n=1 Tax=Arthrobacter sp. zg-Y916 TaxID=2894190 RepID=UPI001E4ED684|nr:DUF4839 domain-containing protein [Arthrobacter sp. zg-Y916]MCC9192119.1 DUF4839 domain-containing protein [Arthrobacter sp. zg-Y916]
MADDELQYELKTVRAIRGAEARTTAKWQKEGWEFVSQDKGTLRSEITFRRPVRKTPWRLVAVVGVVVAVLIAVAITIGAIQEGNGNAVANPGTSATQTSSSEQPNVPSTAAEATPSERPFETSAAAEPAEAALTVENSSDLAFLLVVTDTCSESIAVFAAKHKGESIAFDGSIGAMNPHGDYKTRYDILVGAGDFSETSSPGPAFQFRDVNTTSDLRFMGANVPDSIGVGDNLRITARVVGFEETSCLLLLNPVHTSFR